MTDPAPISIRLARPEDYAEVGRITVAAYRGLDGFENDTGYETELVDVSARAAAAEVFVALADGKLCGAMTYVPDETNPLSEWEGHKAAGMRMLAIDPVAQGKGVGRLMTDFALERARATGHKLFLLHSASFMTGAHRLYESFGFERFPEIDFEVQPVVLWGFRLEL